MADTPKAPVISREMVELLSPMRKFLNGGTGFVYTPEMIDAIQFLLSIADRIASGECVLVPRIWEPEFDVMVPEQERLAIKFCEEISGRKGEKGSPPDPVRLLEMANDLYKAERRAMLQAAQETQNPAPLNERG